MTLVEAGAIGLAFLFGAIPFGPLLTRLKGGPDLRTVGSGNIGATNALRAGGVAIGVSTLVLDALKGSAGLWIAMSLSGVAWRADEPLVGWLVVAPVVGHCFSPFVRFRGGKGVATAIGVLLVADLPLVAISLAVFLLMAIPSRMVSPGSLGFAIATAIGAFVRHGFSPLAAGLAVVSLIVLLRHHENVVRLVQGKERRYDMRSDGGDSS